MDIRARILELCIQHGITLNELALSAILTQSTINNITSRRNKSITVSTLEKLCDGLGITLAEFFEPTRFPELPPEAHRELREFEQQLIKKYRKK
jgi:transcriptional regulator with XRE-family HTH domain